MKDLFLLLSNATFVANFKNTGKLYAFVWIYTCVRLYTNFIWTPSIPRYEIRINVFVAYLSIPPARILVTCFFFFLWQ